MGLLDAVTKPFKAIVDAGKDVVEGAIDVGKDVVKAGGEVLDSVADIPVVGGAVSTFLRANPVTGPAMVAFDAVRGGIDALEGRGLRGLLPLAGSALGAVGVPAPAVDAITGAAKLADGLSDRGAAAKDEAGTLREASTRQVLHARRAPAEGAAGAPSIEDLIRTLAEQLRASREAPGGGCRHAS